MRLQRAGSARAESLRGYLAELPTLARFGAEAEPSLDLQPLATRLAGAVRAGWSPAPPAVPGFRTRGQASSQALSVPGGGGGRRLGEIARDDPQMSRG